jgi:uncharacterized phiE125 gp8 family phage protein
MWNRLTRTVDPVGDVLTLADMKVHLHVEAADTGQDTDIQGKINAAVRRVDGPRGLGIALLDQTWRLSLDRWPCFEVELPLGPVKAVTSVTYVDVNGAVQTLDPSLYELDLDKRPARLFPTFGNYWPLARLKPGAVKITFTAGYGAAANVPEDIVLALKLLTAHWFEHREAVVGVEARDSSTPLPLGVDLLLEDYRWKLA